MRSIRWRMGRKERGRGLETSGQFRGECKKKKSDKNWTTGEIYEQLEGGPRVTFTLARVTLPWPHLYSIAFTFQNGIWLGLLFHGWGEAFHLCPTIFSYLLRIIAEEVVRDPWSKQGQGGRGRRQFFFELAFSPHCCVAQWAIEWAKGFDDSPQTNQSCLVLSTTKEQEERLIALVAPCLSMAKSRIVVAILKRIDRPAFFFCPSLVSLGHVSEHGV